MICTFHRALKLVPIFEGVVTSSMGKILVLWLMTGVVRERAHGLEYELHEYTGKSRQAMVTSTGLLGLLLFATRTDIWIV